jgi:isopentenyl phosphate kinase
VITNKEKPLSPNLRNIRLICRELYGALNFATGVKMILIHGGGSFGHYYAKKFGLGTTAVKSQSAEGLSRTAAAMISLHSIILDELCKAGVYCGTTLPIELFPDFDSPSLTREGRNRLDSLFENGLVPITFGYVNLESDRSYIVSGDKIAVGLANSLPVRKTIFVMDVDGVFQSSDLKGKIIRDLTPEQTKIHGSIKKYDVTGGIEAKISTGFELSSLGSDVYFLNGTKSGRLLKALRGSDDVLATRIYSMKRAASYSAR